MTVTRRAAHPCEPFVVPAARRRGRRRPLCVRGLRRVRSAARVPMAMDAVAASAGGRMGRVDRDHLRRCPLTPLEERAASRGRDARQCRRFHRAVRDPVHVRALHRALAWCGHSRPGRRDCLSASSVLVELLCLVPVGRSCHYRQEYRVDPRVRRGRTAQVGRRLNTIAHYACVTLTGRPPTDGRHARTCRYLQNAGPQTGGTTWMGLPGTVLKSGCVMGIGIGCGDGTRFTPRLLRDRSMSS